MKNLPIVLLFSFPIACLAQHHAKTIYVCPPCHSTCDRQQFHEPGNCSTCGMKLVPQEDIFETEEFFFTFNNTRYSAEIGKPGKHPSKATIVIIPGHGKTDFVGGTHYYALRQFFTRMGFSTLVWDKKGCGKSEGIYEHHQSVESSAQEAIAAIAEYKRKGLPGSGQIGLWGISRGGWICPLIIDKYKRIAFWISVSGTDSFDTFRYMVETNLQIEGRKEDDVKTLMKEFDHYVNVLRKGGESYDQFILSTEKLFSDPFYISLGQKRVSEAEFNSAPEYYRKSSDQFDEKTGLYIFIPNFENILNKIECPVLAIFGENDSQVNWRSTKALYEKTIGKNHHANLKTETFPDCNHNMMKCKTGGLYENLQPYNGAACDGYYEAMQTWLITNAFAR
jgi:alpha/beta superfamily hydrolase